MTHVPEVDFTPFKGMVVPAPGTSFVPNEAQLAVGKQLREILTTHGFVYAAGLVPPEVVGEAFAASRAFFAETTNRDALQPLSPETNMGYGRLGGEALNARRGNDLKEVFNVRKDAFAPGSKIAQGTPEGFMPAAAGIWESCCRGALQALLAFGVAMELENPATFAQAVKTWDLTTMRINHYPASTASEKFDETSALPCGEHTDFGAVTLLFLEDGAPGLEARRPEGGWMPAKGRRNTVLLNTGALLARWCNDRVKATPHRVVSTNSERYSIAFFCDPDSAELVQVLPEFASGDGADGVQYPPITAGDFLRQCLNGSLLGQVNEEAKRALVV